MLTYLVPKIFLVFLMYQQVMQIVTYLVPKIFLVFFMIFVRPRFDTSGAIWIFDSVGDPDLGDPQLRHHAICNL